MTWIKSRTILEKKEIRIHIHCDSEEECIGLGAIIRKTIIPQIEKLGAKKE